MNVTSENPIKTLRLKNNVTQEELADAIGVCRTTIQAWETGKKQPRSKNLKKITGYFSLSREEINLYFKEIEDESEDPTVKENDEADETPQLVTTATQMEIAINEVSYIQEQNIRNSIKAAEAAQALGCGRFLFSGSQAEYGVHREVMTEDAPCAPVS